MSNYAYVTLATTETFLEGAKFLYHSLKRVNSKYPLIILVTTNLWEHLKSQETKEKKEIWNSYKIIPYYKFMHGYEDTINKLQIYNLIEYDKLLFLDADIYVLQNIDYIFDSLKNYNFYAKKVPEKHDPNLKRIIGSHFLCTPQINKFQQFLDFNSLRTIRNDEEALMWFFEQDFFTASENFEDRKKFQSIDKCLYHDSNNTIKYWETLKTLIPLEKINYFLDYTNEEIYEIFSLIIDLRDIVKRGEKR